MIDCDIANNHNHGEVACQSDISVVEIECGLLPKRLKKVRNTGNANQSHNAFNQRSQGHSSESLLNSQSSDKKPGTRDCLASCDNTSNPEDRRKSFNNKDLPLHQFRPGYLWVSDLTRQHWCEQQLYYSFTEPGLVEEKPVMTEGTNLHLERGRSFYEQIHFTKIRLHGNIKICGNLWSAINSLVVTKSC